MAEILCDSKSITITVAEEPPDVPDAFWTIWRTPPTIPFGGEDWIGVRYKNTGTKAQNVCAVSYTHLTLPTTPYV